MSKARESWVAAWTPPNGGAPGWLRTLRDEGMHRFRALGFPTTRLEEWKYTNVAPIAEGSFARPEHSTEPGATALPLEDAIGVLVVDGRVRGGAVESDGARVFGLEEALRRAPDLVDGRLGRIAGFDDESFTALSTAFLEDAVVVHVAKGRAVGRPIVLRFVSGGSGAATASFPRVLVVAEESSEATIIEVHEGTGTYFTSPVTEIALGANAALSHCKVQLEGADGLHVARIEARQESASRFFSCSVSLGGALVRNDIRTAFEAEGAECHFDGLYVTGGRQHVDHHTTIDHRRPRCASRELYKGVLAGRSTAVFNGKVYVRPDAQRSDAQQVNKNLLLSDSATINTKPQLEIFADDVRCSHGATIGRLDEKALFYLRSRGIDAAVARELLIHAFANEVVGRIRTGSLRERLESALAARLERAPLTEATA